MIRLFILCSLLLALPMSAADILPESDQAVSARGAALDLAGAFTANDGYKVRDGYHLARLKKGESQLFQVNLYAGNSYWFCAAGAPATGTLSVTLFDETGAPVAIQPFADPARAAAGFTAANSGLYYVKTTLLDDSSSEGSTICLLYAYK